MMSPALLSSLSEELWPGRCQPASPHSPPSPAVWPCGCVLSHGLWVHVTCAISRLDLKPPPQSHSLLLMAWAAVTREAKPIAFHLGTQMVTWEKSSVCLEPESLRPFLRVAIVVLTEILPDRGGGSIRLVKKHKGIKTVPDKESAFYVC
jgi:hypothetical protein